MFWLKSLLVCPYIFCLIIKACWWHRKICQHPNAVAEKKRYYWTKKVCKLFLWLYSVKIKTYQLENWKNKACIILPNHQSVIDSVALFVINDFKIHPPLAFISKLENKSNFLMSRFCDLVDTIYLDQKNAKSVLNTFQEAASLLKIPRSLVVFPEGQRTYSNQLIDFKPGVHKLLLMSFVPILPVTLIDSYKPTKHRWRFGTNTVHVVFHNMIEPENLNHQNSFECMNRIKQIIEQGFKMKLD